VETEGHRPCPRRFYAFSALEAWWRSFGPHPRDFSYEIPQKIKALALKTSLNTRLKENNFLVLDEFKVEGA